MNIFKLSRLSSVSTFSGTSVRYGEHVKGWSSFLCLRAAHQTAPPPQIGGDKSPKSYLSEFKAPDTVEEEIYYGPLTPRIRSVKVFSLLTSAMGICAQPMILQRAAELEASTGAIAATCGVVGFFTFVTPFLLHAVTRKYVTTVSYDKAADSYTAIIFTFFLRKKPIRFKPGEAEVPEISGFTSVKIRGTPLFMDAKLFSDVYHYKRIMGYDKPLDFKLS